MDGSTPSRMSADLLVFYLLLATLFAFVIATAAIGWVVQRARARSREINDQISGIHRRLDRQESESEYRTHRRAQLDSLILAESEVQFALAKGDLPAASTVKLLGHIQDLREALLLPERGA